MRKHKHYTGCTPPCLDFPRKRGGIGLALVLFASIRNLQSRHNFGPRRPALHERQGLLLRSLPCALCLSVIPAGTSLMVSRSVAMILPALAWRIWGSLSGFLPAPFYMLELITELFRRTKFDIDAVIQNNCQILEDKRRRARQKPDIELMERTRELGQRRPTLGISLEGFRHQNISPRR